jgi:hypothetical protein
MTSCWPVGEDALSRPDVVRVSPASLQAARQVLLERQRRRELLTPNGLRALFPGLKPVKPKT